MKLIFITRKIDRGDSLTGFVFGWISTLAKNLDHLFVICQEKGDVSGLPNNVEVHSFGKERGHGRLRQGYTLLGLGFRLGRQADGFLVHMHPIYLITVWWPAKLFRKKLILWYTHKSVDLKLRAAHFLADEVLTASQESFRLPSKKVRIIGHGIDLKKFSAKGGSALGGQIPNSKFNILSIGRISPVKDYETLIQAARVLVKKQIRDFEVNIYGRVGLEEHQSYMDSLVRFVRNAELEDYVKFQGELDYEFVDEIYREADVFVNLSMTGSIDKNVLEAAACETIVLTSNEAFREPLQNFSGDLFFERNNPADLAEKIIKIKNWNANQRAVVGQRLRSWVQEEHNLDKLAVRIVERFQ